MLVCRYLRSYSIIHINGTNIIINVVVETWTESWFSLELAPTFFFFIFEESHSRTSYVRLVLMMSSI